MDTLPPHDEPTDDALVQRVRAGDESAFEHLFERHRARVARVAARFFPRREPYASELDLPLAIALLSSYLQQAVQTGSLFVGELDLTSRVRRPDPNYLAELAQVSKMSVSRVLNGQAGVSEKTRQRILEAVSELGYVPNLNPRLPFNLNLSYANSKEFS